MHTLKHTHTYAHTCAHTHTHTHANTHTHTHTPTYAHTHTNTCVRMYVIHTHTHVHAHTDACTHTHTHTHTHTPLYSKGTDKVEVNVCRGWKVLRVIKRTSRDAVCETRKCTRPSPLYRTASDKKLGVGLGPLSTCEYNHITVNKH